MLRLWGGKQIFVNLAGMAPKAKAASVAEVKKKSKEEEKKEQQRKNKEEEEKEQQRKKKEAEKNEQMRKEFWIDVRRRWLKQGGSQEDADNFTGGFQGYAAGIARFRCWGWS